MPKSFCSGQVVFLADDGYTLEDVIFLLENREFSEFRINSDEGYALIDSEVGEIEISIEPKGSDKEIPEETVKRMLDVLEHIEECIEKANDWIRSLNLKNERTLAETLDRSYPAWLRKKIPDQFQERFMIDGLNFGDVSSSYDHFSRLIGIQYRSGHHPKKRRVHYPIKSEDIFSIDFDVNCFFFFHVKFDYKNMLPYEIEIRHVYGT